MSRPCHYSRYKLWLTQICRWLFFVYTVFPVSPANGLESRDAVLVNFHRRYNVSRVAILHNGGYLPPPISTPDFFLPEVIDNRARNVALARTNETGLGMSYRPLERDPLRVFTRNGPQDARHGGWQLTPRRPVFSRGGQSQKTTSHPSLLNEISAPSLVSGIGIEEMSCQNVGDDLFFRASIKAPPRILAPPVIDNAAGGKACQVLAAGDSYHVKLEKDQVWDCGVVDCSADGNQSYCLDLRFPVIPGLRTRDDERVTLRCRTRDRIAHHTRRISVKTLEAEARNAPSVLHGGVGNALNVDVGLFRKTHGAENVFDARIQSGGTVVLGEEILLRVLVSGDDGWRYSKIGEVTVHYEERQERKVLSLWILDKDGCLNSDVREICPREQYRVSPLESYLIFQAFMFEGMRETDEVFLTVKATACLEPTDCILDCPVGHVRHARSLTDQNNTVEWQDDIILRVLPPGRELRDPQNYYLAIAPPLIALFALIALLWIVNNLLHRRSIKS